MGTLGAATGSPPFKRQPPYDIAGALRFSGQAQVHLVKCLTRLAASLVAQGVHRFENTRVHETEAGGPCRVATDRGTVAARYLIVATHVPVVGAGNVLREGPPHVLHMLAAVVDPSRAPGGRGWVAPGAGRVHAHEVHARLERY